MCDMSTPKPKKPAQQPLPTPAAIFAKQMAESRRRQGLTQAQLAEKVTSRGVPMARESVAKTETGVRGLTLNDAIAIAVALGVPLTTLMLPRESQATVALTPNFITSAQTARSWLRGRGVLRPEDQRAVRDMESEEDRLVADNPLMSIFTTLNETMATSITEGDKAQAIRAIDSLEDVLRVQRRALEA
jgi:transcriptional regulator with XRE-family HTH domain